MNMTIISTIIVSVLSLAGTVIGSFASNSKTQAVIELRLKNLETKVDKHNQVIDRTYELEKNYAVMQEHLASIEEDLDKIARRS